MTGENWDLLDPEARMALRVPKVGLGFLGILVLLGLMAKRASLVFQGCQVTQVDKVQRDLRDFKVFQERMEKKEHEVQLESLGQEDRGDQLVHVERGVQEVQQERRGLRVTQEAMVLLDHQAKGVFQGLRVQLDSLDQRAHLAQLEKMDFLDTLGREVKLASKARLDLLDHQVLLDLRAQQVKLDQWETGATQDLLGPLVSRAFRELQGKRGPRVTRVPLALLVKMAHLV